MNVEARKKVLSEVMEARYALNRTWHLAYLDSEEDPELKRVVVGSIRAANAQLWTASAELGRLLTDEEVDA